eukprot:8101739-Pyramimonas_sp.AAC.1
MSTTSSQLQRNAKRVFVNCCFMLINVMLTGKKTSPRRYLLVSPGDRLPTRMSVGSALSTTNPTSERRDKARIR